MQTDSPVWSILAETEFG